MAKEGVGDRCKTVGGDMFKSIPKGADIYTLSYVLIDWDDDKITTIIKNIRDAIAENGKLLVIDTVLTLANEYQWGKWLDLELLSFGYGGARTEAE